MGQAADFFILNDPAYMSLLMALSGHFDRASECPLSGKADMPFCGCKCLLLTQSAFGEAIVKKMIAEIAGVRTSARLLRRLEGQWTVI